MPQPTGDDTRTRLLNAAADLIAASPGDDFSLRAVCEAAGVTLPTLYHFFGSKQGLIDAVTERGFDLYLSQKAARELTGDPIGDIRAGWDEHVAFGLRNPGLYALMYGTVRPGHAPDAQQRPTAALRELTRRAADAGRLVVDPDHAASHVLAANVGVTLRQIVLAEEDRALSDAVREGVIAAITGGRATPGRDAPARAVTEWAAAHPEVLGEPETQLLISWLHRVAAAAADH
ncbi:TetR/AcrR family transcriptional regulator [Microbacterium sp.]|uniref:TetR/AcrR family transcriptional regulator n=1 Tax=Microbacterium sp. TaxID=51671 RepID=UPI003C7287CE